MEKSCSGYFVRLPFRFRPMIVKQHIHDALMEQLSDKDYHTDTVNTLVKTVAQAVNDKLKSKPFGSVLKCKQMLFKVLKTFLVYHIQL